MVAKKQKKPEPLTEKDIKTFEKELSERKKQIKTALEKLEIQNENADNELLAGLPDYGDKMDDNVQEMAEFSTSVAQKGVLEKNLRDIETSLKRIKEGTYGKCKYCGEDIGKKRMEARPVASACVACKTKLQNS